MGPATRPAASGVTRPPVNAALGLGAGSAGTNQPSDKLISLNFPENTPLKVLIDYVGQKVGMNLLYDEQVGNKKITIKANSKIPESSLLGLLENVLKMNDLALVDADQKGWKRIVPTQNLISTAVPPSQANLETRPTAAVTQVFTIEHAETAKVDQLLKPFLSGKGASTIDLADRGLLIVTDYVSNMARIEELIRLIDQPKPKVAIEFVPVKYLEATALAQQASQLLASKRKAEGVRIADQVDIKFDGRTNQLILFGLRSDVDEALKIIAALDVPLETVTRTYSFFSVSPERIDRLTKDLIGAVAAKTRYTSSVDREGGLLIVTTTKEIHDQIEALKKSLDTRTAESSSPVRFYKLTNAIAAEVLRTIEAMEGTTGLGAATVEGATTRPSGSAEPAPTGTGGVPSGVAPVTGYSAQGIMPINPPVTSEPPNPAIVPAAAGSVPISGSGVGSGGGGTQTIVTKRARITADANTNSIIVITDPENQRIYEKLIKQLDRRRPQVLIEATLITLDTSKGFSLGVEISRKFDVNKDTKVLTFSNFGLSTIDSATARLTLTPASGFNGALLSQDIADVVLHALSTHARARVVSAPKILVNDNAPGSLSSVNEAPYTSINASNTVSTTSFAGYATAGTTISLTPHISEGNHLQVEYQVTLSSFSGQPSGTIPPPRQTNTIASKVTIPDGYTIVVGGLNRSDFSKSVSAIPFLEYIPILNLIGGSRTINDSHQSLFVFIRPVILRDDNFEDLKYLSAKDLEAAALPSEFPTCDAITMN